MHVTGISPDGTLVFGSLERDDIPARHNRGLRRGTPPGLSAVVRRAGGPADRHRPLLVSGRAQAVRGTTSACFLADGTFFLIDTRRGTQPAAEYTSGFERGRYHWDASTGAFSFATLQDTNGSVGLSGGNGAPASSLDCFGRHVGAGE